MDQHILSPENIRIFLLLCSAFATGLLGLLFRLRAADVRRIEIHRDALDRIEQKVSDIAENLAIHVGWIQEAKAHFVRINGSCDHATKLHVDTISRIDILQASFQSANAENVLKFGSLEKRLEELHGDYRRLVELVSAHETELAELAAKVGRRRTANGLPKLGLHKQKEKTR
jgi:hypothetical protein